MITEKQRQEYAQLRDEFRQKRDGLKIQIQTHNTRMDLERMAIVKLKQTIKNSRPHLEGADSLKICGGCDIYSMKYEGIRDHYECMICGEKQF